MKKPVLLLSALLLASCGGTSGGEGSGSHSEPSDTPENQNLVVLFHVDAGTPEGVAYKRRLDAFNKENAASGIRVTGKFVARTTGVSTYETELTNMKKQGTLPDIITFDAPMCAKYAMDRFLYDVSFFFSKEELATFVTTNTYQGKLYGLPIQESSAGL